MIGLAGSRAKLTRTWKFGAASVTLILLFVAFAVMDSQVVSAAPSPLVNESFETGDLGGWAVYVPAHGFAGAVTSFTQSLQRSSGTPPKMLPSLPKRERTTLC